jgi:hypothetical protein
LLDQLLGDGIAGDPVISEQGVLRIEQQCAVKLLAAESGAFIELL